MLSRAGFVALVLAALGATEARAVPAFARRYKTACTTCHSLPPRLNPYGLAFRSNGYRLPSGEPRRQEEDVALGAPEWDALFPAAILSGNVSDVAPVAGWLRMALEKEPDGGTEFSVLGILLASGNLGRHASYFLSGGFSQQGAGLGRAFIQLDQLAGPWLNVRAGQMEPAFVPFSRQTQRLGYVPYLAFESKAYGIELGKPRPAVELYGAGSDPGVLRGLRYAVGVADRDGSAADLYARASYKLGGVAAAGDRSAGEQPARLVAPLAETSLQLGGFAFRGAAPGDAARLQATRVGADAMLLAGNLELDAAGWLGRDAGVDATSWSWMVSGSVRPWPWLMVIGRYEAQVAEVAQRRAVLAVRGALQQNVAVTLESEVELPDGSVGAIAGVFLGF